MKKLITVYGYASLGVAVLSLATDVARIGLRGGIGQSILLLTIADGIQWFWFCISIAATFLLAIARAPIRSALYYSICSMISIALGIIGAIAFANARQSFADMVVGWSVIDVVLTGIWIKLLSDLLRWCKSEANAKK